MWVGRCVASLWLIKLLCVKGLPGWHSSLGRAATYAISLCHNFLLIIDRRRPICAALTAPPPVTMKRMTRAVRHGGGGGGGGGGIKNAARGGNLA